MGINLRLLRYQLPFLIAFVSTGVFAQTNQNEYLEAKRLFNNGNYAASAGAFGALKEDGTFGPYARFYNALARYKVGSFRNAREEWKTLRSLYPTWQHTIEVLYWLTISSFELGEIEEGLEFLETYTDRATSVSLSRQTIPKYLANSELDDLITYNEAYPKNREIAMMLATKVSQQPYSQRDSELLERLILDHNLEPTGLIDKDIENVFRSAYTVAIVLPFMFESYENAGAVIRNKLVMDFYQGLLLAQEDLDTLGMRLELLPYDTKKSEDTTRELLTHIENADLIVGPLYPGPIEVIRELSKAEKINMVNPLTSNTEYIGDNPFAYLFRAGYPTMARQLAAYAASNHDNNSALVYFGNNIRDSLFAEQYREVMIAEGKEILDFRSLDELSAKALLDTLIEQYEEIYPKEVADSIAEIEGRFVKTRRLKTDEEELMEEDPEFTIPYFLEEDEEGNVVEEDPEKLVAYEMKFKVRRDTAGSILIATRSNTIANNIISAVATREDSTGLYGYGNWFEFKVATYHLLEQVRAKVVLPDFLDKTSDRYRELENRFMLSYSAIPSEYHFHGYEFGRFIGKMLHENGKYFQNGFYDSGLIPGYLSAGFDFRGANDNQIAPIVTIQNYKIFPVNNRIIESEEQ